MQPIKRAASAGSCGPPPRTGDGAALFVIFTAFLIWECPIIVKRKHRVEPPSWLGWALVSVGSVLILHSLALKKPGA